MVLGRKQYPFSGAIKCCGTTEKAAVKFTVDLCGTPPLEMAYLNTVRLQVVFIHLSNLLIYST